MLVFKSQCLKTYANNKLSWRHCTAISRECNCDGEDSSPNFYRFNRVYRYIAHRSLHWNIKLFKSFVLDMPYHLLCPWGKFCPCASLKFCSNFLISVSFCGNWSIIIGTYASLLLWLHRFYIYLPLHTLINNSWSFYMFIRRHFFCLSGQYLARINYAVDLESRLELCIRRVKNLSGLYHKYSPSLFLLFKWFDWINCMINKTNHNHISMFSKKSPLE